MIVMIIVIRTFFLPFGFVFLTLSLSPSLFLRIHPSIYLFLYSMDIINELVYLNNGS